MEEIKSFNITITGQVQGVSFRYYTTLKADELGVKGTVRNNPDGAVYIEAEGDAVSLEKFIAWCHEGSSFSTVENVRVIEARGIKNFTSFHIVYY